MIFSKLYMYKLVDMIADPKSISSKPPIVEEQNKSNSTYFVATKSSSTSVPMISTRPEKSAECLVLHKCKNCGCVYEASMSTWLECANGMASMDFHGELLITHEVDTAFDINEWLSDLFLSFDSWKTVLWQYVYFFDC
jgi:hypothetical protein